MKLINGMHEDSLYKSLLTEELYSKLPGYLKLFKELEKKLK